MISSFFYFTKKLSYYKEKLDLLTAKSIETEIEKIEEKNSNEESEYLTSGEKRVYNLFTRKLIMISQKIDESNDSHIFRVGEMSAFLAEKMGKENKFVKDIKEFAPLHDIGKIFVHSATLNKNDKLTPEEFEEIKKHTSHATLILDDKYFEMARNIALYHHEKYDGTGYPFKLKGEEIPIEAQIVSIIDVYDALRSRRSYKRPVSHEDALSIITKGDGYTKPNHFSPEVLKIFNKHSDEIGILYYKITKKNIV